jgi:hypothetical protein
MEASVNTGTSEYLEACPECHGTVGHRINCSGGIAFSKPQHKKQPAIVSVDVTDQVSFGNSDDEYLPITKCICGERFGHWNFTIGIYKDEPKECPMCGRRYFFTTSTRVYEVPQIAQPEKP